MAETETTTRIKQVGTVIVPVSNQDRALEFYVGTLGFEKRTDMPYGDGDRWLGDARRGAVVQHERVAVGVGEERHVTHARVEDVAGERDAPLLERRARRRHVLDLQGEVVRVGLERPDAHALRIEHAQGDGARV